MTRMSRCTRSERRVSAHRHRIGSQYPAGAPRVLVIVCALLLASLAAVISTVPTANADTPADPSTTGTASTVSPSTVAVGGTIMFTLSGFPGGVTVQVLIDDGLLAASRPSESEGSRPSRRSRTAPHPVPSSCPSTSSRETTGYDSGSPGLRE